MDTVQTYIPTSATPQLVIQGLNDFIGQELSLPGNWSATIFFQDLKDYPVKSKKELAEAVLDSCLNSINYLEFFRKTRDKDRPCNELQIKLFEIFNNGSIMLYFEPLFLRLYEVNEINQDVNLFLLYLNALSQSPISKWDEILKGIGACCYQWFAKEAELYIRLPYRQSMNTPEEMTDQELFDAIESSLSPTSYRGKISIEDSRSKLIKKYKSHFSS
jgi:hypothetical protein